MHNKKHDEPEALLASLLADYKKPEDLIGENGLLKQLTTLLVEKALDAELTAHLGHEKHEPVANPGGNTRLRLRFTRPIRRAWLNGMEYRFRFVEHLVGRMRREAGSNEFASAIHG